MNGLLAIVGIVIGTLIGIGFLFTMLYKKATKETSFVRTGLGGEKVIKDGGAIVLPVLHEIIPVNMKTLKLKVERINEDSLITKDRMRVDVEADFYVRVNPTKEGISIAAQTLGSRTMKPEELRTLIEGKFIDALRNVAARMELHQLHENRDKFVNEVQNTVKEDLEKNGLELESVSLTNLDQTDIVYLKPENNAFDAEGAKVLTKIIQENKKTRNDIEKNTEVEIENKNLETKAKILEINKKEQILEAQQKTEIEKEKAEKEKEAEIARIEAQKEAEKTKIQNEKELLEANIEKEKITKQKEIEKNKEIKIKEKELEKSVKEKEIQINIDISKKIEEEAKAKAQANISKAEEIKTQEGIETAKQIVEAEREKQLEILKAEKESKFIEIKAEAEANAIKIKAEAKKLDYEIEAKGKENLNKAENVLTKDVLDYRMKIETINKTPEIMEKMVKPMEKINSINIAHIGGNSLPTGITTQQNDTTNFTNNILNTALQYKMYMPFVDNLLKDINFDNKSIKETFLETSNITNKEKEEYKQKQEIDNKLQEKNNNNKEIQKSQEILKNSL